MLWSSFLPISILISLPFTSSSQTAFNSSAASRFRTIIDVLNDDPDYTSLLKLLQRARLIPAINKLNGSTLFAPTNDAIDRHGFWSLAADDTQSEFWTRDNIQQRLRDELLYHLLNYTVDPVASDNNPEVHKTLLFPREPSEPPSDEPPPNPPWLPIPGGTLAGEPQRLRVASMDGDVRVGVNTFGQGGSKVVPMKVNNTADSGVVFGIRDVLDVPSDLATTVSQQSSLSYFSRIATPEIFNYLNNTANLTVFLPVDGAWDVLPPIERKYLESEFSTDDLTKILNLHAVVTDGVHWSDGFEPAAKLTTISGTTLDIVREPESHKTLVSSAEIVEQDIYASNGVLHTVDSLLIPPGAFNITPEKYLLTLNCTSFVSLIHSVNLTSFINSTDESYTILAPSNDVLDLFGRNEEGLPERGSDLLRRTLMYHFLPGKWTTKKLKDGMLVETALKEKGLEGGSQVMSISVSGSELNHVSFGGAAVMDAVHDPKNKTLIYLISRPLTPPSDFLETALPDLDFATFYAAVSSSTSFANRLRRMPQTTFLIPVNEAFKRLGQLVSKHLLSSSSKVDLENVILHHVLDSVEYSSALQNGSQKSYGTLEESDIRVDRPKNGSITVQASGGWEGMEARVTVRNMLTSTGVVHELSDVLLPRSLNLTIGKLVRAAEGSTMTAILSRAGMGWILNGTAPPDDFEWMGSDFKGAGWTLLCPTDSAFKGFNLTRLYSNPERLQAIVEQHLIPTAPKQASLLKDLDSLHTNKPIIMDNSATYTTLRTRDSAYGDVVFGRSDPSDDSGGSGYLVGIKDARGTDGKKDWARVLAWGRTTNFNGIGGVIQIDQVLAPYQPSWWMEYGAPVGVGIVGVIMICLFFLGVRAFWRRDTSEATYEPVGGYSNDDDSN